MTGPDTTVCDWCVDEEYLSAFIRGHATELTCSYCNRTAKKPVALPFGELLASIEQGIGAEYEDAANEVPYDSSEGGYQLPTMSTEEVLADLGFASPSAALMNDVVDALPDNPWVEHDPFALSRVEALRWGWKEFCRLVKHQTRFLFFKRKPQHTVSRADEIPASEMLRELGSLVRELNLIGRLRVGTRLFRVRQHAPSESPSTMADLGPPPVERAVRANRMSPSGISMFYVSLDGTTAAAETLRRRSRTQTMVTTAEFKLTRDTRVLDLTAVPEIPSCFDDSIQPYRRHGILFIHAFRGDLIQPVDRNGREHIDYVPSQVVTEYFRYRFRARDRHRVRGILYPSAARPAGKSCVLFYSHDDCRSGAASARHHAPPFTLLAHTTRPLRGHP